MKAYALVLAVIGAFGVGFGVGKNYSVNPTLHTWRPPMIVEVAPGDVFCPQNHSCTWQVVDINDNIVIQSNIPPSNCLDAILENGEWRLKSGKAVPCGPTRR